MKVVVTALLLFLPWACCECVDSQSTVGLLFGCQVDRRDFFQDIPPDVAVEFSASLRGKAGLPDWLKLQQQTSVSHGFLYGTPSTEEALQIEVKALRRDNYNLVVQAFNITVLPSPGSIVLVSEIYITNYELPEMLNREVLQSFTSALTAAFASPSAAVVRFITPSARGILVPLPPAKHGVIVEVTPGLDVNSISMATANQAAAVQGNCSGSFNRPPENFRSFSDFGFQVDWCKYIVYEVADGSTAPLSEVSTAPDRPLPTASSSRVSLVVIVVLCFVALVLVMTGLAWVFFGGRKKAFYLSHEKHMQKSVSVEHARNTSQGPLHAQKHLSDLAQVPRKRNNSMGQEEGRAVEDTLLEFRDLIDYNNNAPAERPPPPYEYNEPPRRYRLITL